MPPTGASDSGDHALTIVSIVLGGASLAGAVYWLAVAWHVAREWRAHPTARAGLRLPPVAARVCVVVPAHNEAPCIGTLVRSLRAQTHPDLRVVLALDRCTDGTAEAARAAIDGDPRVELIEIDHCPPDWAGKVHAIHAGMERSAGARDAELLLFADADTEFHPECVRACAALLRARGVGLLSLVSTLTSDRWFERVAQPACGIELLRQYPLARASRAERRRAFANGQFMLFEAGAYRRIGGHAAARAALLEDIALARLARDAGVGALVVLADGLLTCRMYGSWAEFRRGWQRIFTEAATRRADRLDKASMLARTLGTFVPLAAFGALTLGLLSHTPGAALSFRAIAGHAAVATGAAALGAMATALALAFGRGRVPVWHAVFYPVGAWLTGGILRAAARALRTGEPTEWAGRVYTRERRGR